MVTVTPAAAEEIKRLVEKQNEKDVALRMAVKGGGCSGFSYALAFDKIQLEDTTFESSGVKVVVDPKSLELLSGITLDFVDSLEGRGFKFLNPNAKSSCGCGESFSA
ncbi:MAG: iron-sulfur cluster assembly accessory protein [Candidatus Omnitrophica bacterium]|nr:iron-sulfur cluster assembly accessory protein [Candidatus Omnitrophota bacterium]